MKLLKQDRNAQNAWKFKRQRNGLLAKVHIAIKDLGFSDDNYRSILKDAYGVNSAANLSIEELQDFVKRCEYAGWTPRQRNKRNQLKALQMRAEEIAYQIPNGRRRLKGLVRKLCGIDCVEWMDLKSLKQLLAALERIARDES